MKALYASIVQDFFNYSILYIFEPFYLIFNLTLTSLDIRDISKVNLINEGSECKKMGSYLKIESNGVQTRVQQDLDEHEYNQL